MAFPTGFPLVRTRSLTPSEFALALEDVSLSDDTGGASAAKETGYDSDEIDAQIERVVRSRLAQKDYIEINRLAFEVCGGYTGLSSFFLSFIASAPKLIQPLLQPKKTDEVVIKIFKENFYKKMVYPITRCNANSVDYIPRLGVSSEDIGLLVNRLYNHRKRRDALTERTLRESTKPKRVDVRMSSLAGLFKEGLLDRESLVDLRVRENLQDQPRAIECYENFLRQIGETIESIKPKCETFFLKEEGPREERVRFTTVKDVLMKEMGRFSNEETLPRYFVFIRPYGWDPKEDGIIFPSLSLDFFNPHDGSPVQYHLKGFSFVDDVKTMEFKCCLFEEKIRSYEWSQKVPSPVREDLIFSTIQADEMALNEKRESLEIDSIIQDMKDTYIDFLVYEKS